MSKVKYFLRKLHIGSSGGGGAAGLGDHHRLGVSGSHRPVTGPIPSLEPGPIPVQPVRNPTPAPADLRPDEFSFLEEEFQVQLALALSASSADHVEPREDPNESAQIDAVKRISLGRPVKAAGGSVALVEFLSLRYWVSQSPVIGDFIYFMCWRWRMLHRLLNEGWINFDLEV